MSAKIMTVSFAVSSRASCMLFHFMPRNTAITKMTNAPRAPASVGVALPEYME